MRTTHFSEAEFVELAEDTLDPRRAAHADTCAPCREQGDRLRAMLRATAVFEVPEPSPLFWEHFQSRVRAGIAAEPVASRSGWSWPGVRGLVPFAAAMAVVLAVLAGLLVRGVRPAPAPLTASVAVAPVADGRTDATPDAENAEVWAVLTAAASTVEFDEARDVGMRVHPAAIDHAVQDLSAAELAELGRLLQTELKRSSN